MPKEKELRKYSVVLLHTQGKNACNGVAFYYKIPIDLFDTVHSRFATYPNGEAVVSGEKIECGTCRKLIGSPILDHVSIWYSECEELWG